MLHIYKRKTPVASMVLCATLSSVWRAEDPLFDFNNSNLLDTQFIHHTWPILLYFYFYILIFTNSCCKHTYKNGENNSIRTHSEV